MSLTWKGFDIYNKSSLFHDGFQWQKYFYSLNITKTKGYNHLLAQMLILFSSLPIQYCLATFLARGVQNKIGKMNEKKSLQVASFKNQTASFLQLYLYPLQNSESRRCAAVFPFAPLLLNLFELTCPKFEWKTIEWIIRISYIIFCIWVRTIASHSQHTWKERYKKRTKIYTYAHRFFLRTIGVLGLINWVILARECHSETGTET